MERKEQVLDIINLLLGAFLFLTPWLFEFTTGAMAWNAWASGAIIALVSLAALTSFAVWEEWVNLVLGVWVLVSPWVLGFEATTAMRIDVVVGIIVAVLAAIELWWLHRAPPHATVSH
jgi:hypothetical protein